MDFNLAHPRQMKQLNDLISIISFRGDKSASAANSMKDTTNYYQQYYN